MTAEDALRKVLVDDAAVAAILSARVYPHMAPQTVDLPFAVLVRVAGTHHHHMIASSGLVHAILQLDIYAETKLAVDVLAEAIRDAADGYTGAVTIGANSIDLRQCYMSNDRTGFITPSDAGDNPIFKVSQDWDLMHKESVPLFP